MWRRATMWLLFWVVPGLFSVAACGGGDSTTTDDGGGDVEETGDGEDVPDGRDIPDRPDDGADTTEEGADGDDDGGGETDVPPTCGDGILDDGEECDDGNDIDDDGCDSDCTWSCVASTECDDGNDCNGAESCADHVCAAGTPPADGTACTLPGGDTGVCRGGSCVGVDCGNGTVDTGEECDDGNTDNTDACLNTCRNARCGDGFVRTGLEQCDDGNPRPDDGCENDCTWTCEAAAECDDGEACNGAEACAGHVCVSGTPPADGTACALPGGGAGVCRGGVCAAAACGNGTVDTGEECDDGNTVNTDACLSTCRNARCGDGFVWSGHETCDGDPASTCTSSCGTTGTRTCEACAWSDCVPPAEVCNGLDEDCVGGPDNGFTCAVGATGSCTTTCGTTGNHACSTACEWGVCNPPAEVCNGLDEDCVGGPDNGFDCVRAATESCMTTCASTGRRTCSDTCAWGACVPPIETCNGLDDDCVDGPDNGFACVRDTTRSCPTTCGSTGTQTCGSTCAWGACAPPAETCNGRDDDCDGTCDNTFACCAGQSVTCTTTCGSTGVGTCTSSCARPSGSACTPPIETCNGLDDDCVGGPDNGFPCVMGSTRACTIGACAGTQTCGSSCTWSTCNLGPAPANDTCAGATPLTPGTAVRGTTCAANNDYNPPAACVPFVTTPAPDVTYVVRITVRSNVIFDTDGTTWNTVLYVYNGACSGTPVACNDDIGGGNTASRISTTLDPGTYYIVVDGRQSANFGPFVLNSSVRAAGDECADAIPLTLSAGRTTVTGSTTGYTPSTGSCDSGSGTPGRDVWYRFTLAQREMVFVNTFGSAFDTQLALLGGCGGVAPACTDDTCGLLQEHVVRNLAPGTYYVLLDGYAGASGNYTLNIEHLPVGSDGTPTVLPAGLATYTGNTMSLTPGVVTGSCGGDRAPEDTYYWTTCPADAGGAFSATTCGGGIATYDTLLYVRSGATGNDLDCNDDAVPACTPANASRINATIPAGAGLFAFYVDGYGTASGNYTAAVNRP